MNKTEIKTILDDAEDILYKLQDVVTNDEDKESISSIIDLCQTQKLERGIKN